jgi:hypothetical protein
MNTTNTLIHDRQNYSCIHVLGVVLPVMYKCVSGIHILGVVLPVMYKCVSGIHILGVVLPVTGKTTPKT